MTGQSEDPRIAAANAYVAQGWQVFVLGVDKKPLGNCQNCPRHNAEDPLLNGRRHDANMCECLTCHGFYAATRDLARIELMLQRHPHGMLAIRTGVASGLIVIDAEGYNDTPNLPSGLEVLDDWETWTSTAERDGWSLPETLKQRTGSGGIHLIYKLPSGMQIKGHIRVLPGIDIKAEGGYIAVPPGGDGRTWLGGLDDIREPTAQLLAWLRTARGRGRVGTIGNHGRVRSDDPTANNVRPTGYDFNYYREHGAPSGSRDEFINEFCYRLRKAGVPRYLAEQSLRTAYEKMEQPSGNEFTWSDCLGKLDHVWATVITNEEEEKEKNAQKDTDEGGTSPTRGSSPQGASPSDLISSSSVGQHGEDRNAGIRSSDPGETRSSTGRVGYEAQSAEGSLASAQRIEVRAYSADNPHLNTDRLNGEELAHFLDGKVFTLGGDKSRQWYVFDGRRWIEDATGVQRLICREFIDGLRQRAMSGTVDQTEGDMLMTRARHLEQSRGINAALNTWTAPLLARDVTTLDANPWTLNCPNGTIDLRTGELLPHNPLDFNTRMCPTPYDPDARDDLWERVLQEALGNDPDKIRLFVRYAGYTLTGDVSEKKLLVSHGKTDTGKSTVTEPIYRMLGDVGDGGYATVWGADVIQADSLVNRPEKLAKSRAARMVLVGELERNSKMADGFVKQYTGGDTMDAKELYKGSYSFRPQGKLWMATNYVPTSTDKALQGRLIMLPFNHAPDRKDPGVKRYLDLDPKAHRAILAWAVTACLRWQSEGSLGETPWMSEMLRSYAVNSSEVLQFLEDMTTRVETYEESSSTRSVFMAWQAWAINNGVRRPMGERKLQQIIIDDGFMKHRPMGGEVRWLGLKLEAQQRD